MNSSDKLLLKAKNLESGIRLPKRTGKNRRRLSIRILNNFCKRTVLQRYFLQDLYLNSMTMTASITFFPTSARSQR